MDRIGQRALRALSRACGYDVLRRDVLDENEMLLSHGRALASAVRHPPSPDLQARLLVIGRSLAPRRALGHDRVRVGGAADGGYVMLDDFAGVRTAFSLGVGPNVDWDHDVAERGIDVWQFDHTVAGPPRRHRRFHFRRRRIDGVASAEAEDLASLLAAHGSPAPFGNLLKVDIEGSEWGLFAEADAGSLDAFPQIMCEFHGLAGVHHDDHYARMVAALIRLRQAFEVVHVHGNNFAGRTFVAGQALPNVLEVTFAHKGRYAFADDAGAFPTPLDRACDPSGADYLLGDFKFDAGAGLSDLASRAGRTRADAMFDGGAYRAANPDLAVTDAEAWDHWRLWGWSEGRPLTPDECGFDAGAYLAANPDVAAAGFDALTHWRHFGRREGRPRSA